MLVEEVIFKGRKRESKKSRSHREGWENKDRSSQISLIRKDRVKWRLLIPLFVPGA